MIVMTLGILSLLILGLLIETMDIVVRDDI